MEEIYAHPWGNGRVKISSNNQFWKIVFLFSLFIKMANSSFPPTGKCFALPNHGIYTYTGSASNPYQQTPPVNCLTSQKSFQFLAWVMLDADAPDGQLRYLFRYHTLINLEFKGSSTGDHTLVLWKDNESPKELLEVPVGKKGKWMFIWLQVTENGASLAVRSTMNFELENHRLYKKSFSKL